MRPPAKWFLCLGLLAMAALPAWAAEDGRTAAGRQLARTERALAATAQAARAREAGLPRGGAFRAALDRLSGALARAEAGLRAGDARYFAALSDGSRALAELEAVWARTPRRDAAVGSRVTALSAAYRRLRNGYGWEALRRGQGGALTAAEASRFQALKRADAQLAAHLKPVQAKVDKAGDRAMAEQLARLRDQARRVAAAELTLEAYLTAELLNDIVRGEWEAAQHYVKKPYRVAWRKSAPTIEKLATDPGIGFVFATDLSKAEAWTFDDSGNAGEETAAADREAAAPAPAKASPAPPRDETPVDEVEIVDGKPQRTEGVAPEAESPAEPGTTPPATGEPAPPATSAPSADTGPTPAPEPSPAAPDAPPAGTAVDPGHDAAPPAAEPGTGDPGTDQGMEAPQDPNAVAAPPDAEPPPDNEPEVAPPATAPEWPGGMEPPADPNAPDAGQPDQQPPAPPSDDEPLPAEPPPPPPPIV